MEYNYRRALKELERILEERCVCESLLWRSSQLSSLVPPPLSICLMYLFFKPQTSRTKACSHELQQIVGEGFEKMWKKGLESVDVLEDVTVVKSCSCRLLSLKIKDIKHSLFHFVLRWRSYIELTQKSME